MICPHTFITLASMAATLTAFCCCCSQLLAANVRRVPHNKLNLLPLSVLFHYPMSYPLDVLSSDPGYSWWFPVTIAICRRNYNQIEKLQLNHMIKSNIESSSLNHLQKLSPSASKANRHGCWTYWQEDMILLKFKTDYFIVMDLSAYQTVTISSCQSLSNNTANNCR